MVHVLATGSSRHLQQRMIVVPQQKIIHPGLLPAMEPSSPLNSTPMPASSISKSQVKASAKVLPGKMPGRRTMVLHIEDQSGRDYLAERIERYRSGPLTPKLNPPLAQEMQPIEDFVPTELLDLWREDPACPS